MYSKPLRSVKNIYNLFITKLTYILNYLVAISDKEWHKDIYKYSKYLSVILLLITYSGVIYINPNYSTVVHTFIIYYICIILLLRFNSLIKKNNSASYIEYNRGIVFTASILLLTTTIAKNISELFIN